jgi:hypothetical protein
MMDIICHRIDMAPSSIKNNGCAPSRKGIIGAMPRHEQITAFFYQEKLYLPVF